MEKMTAVCYASHLWMISSDLYYAFVSCLSVCSDEDMQSLASLMSMKQADIGNLDDFEEENEEDEENRVNQEEKAAKITGEACLNSSEDPLQVNLILHT